MKDKPVATIYGLSTEGYSIACQIANRGMPVYVVDEATSSAIYLEPEIAMMYPDVISLREDEPLLRVQPAQTVVAKSRYLFFAPTIRRPMQDTKAEILSKFKDAVTALKKGSVVINNLPAGFGGNMETIELLEHITGFEAGSTVSYYYYPVSATRRPRVIGSFDERKDATLADLLADDKPPRRFVNLAASEYLYGMDIVTRFARIGSAIEVCRLADDDDTISCLSANLKDLYVDDMANGLYDLRVIKSSVEGINAISYLMNGAVKGIDGYLKRLVTLIKSVLRRNNLKTSRTRLVLLWTLDRDSMRGEKMEIRQNLANSLRDYVGEIEMLEGAENTLQIDKTTIVIACTRHDAELVQEDAADGNLILIKANPLYEVVQ